MTDFMRDRLATSLSEARLNLRQALEHDDPIMHPKKALLLEERINALMEAHTAIAVYLVGSRIPLSTADIEWGTPQ